jgi:nitronate monooxygenase
MSPGTLRHELSCARALLQSDSELSLPLPIGVGFLGWSLELPNSSDVDLLTVALENRVKAVWFAFGDHTSRWVQFVRDHDQKAGGDCKTVVFVQISSLDEAHVAIRDWRVDVIVAQGSVCPSPLRMPEPPGPNRILIE